MTGQDLLNRMELVNQELQLQSGEDDAERGLIALNVAQDYFESFAAQKGKVFGSSVGSVTATSGVESTTFPAGLLRIDRLQLMDGSEAKWDLDRLRRAGGHAGGRGYFALTQPSGSVNAYWTNGRAIYWSPLPAETSTVRWYGFQAADDITADGDFMYPDIVAFPMAAFAARLIKIGVDDDGSDVAQLAQEAFKGVLDALSLGDRDGAVGFEYSQVHEA